MNERRFLRHLSFSNVIAVIALFIALGGSAYAVKSAKKNSVTSKSIRNGTIRSADIGSGQVKTSDIGDGQVGSADIGDGQVGSAEVADGSLTSSDFDLSSLGDVTAGKSAQGGSVCVQTGTAFLDCLTIQVSLKSVGHIFATADGVADSGSPSVPIGVNRCQMTVDGIPFTRDIAAAADFAQGEEFSFAGVTGALEAGDHSVTLQCKGNGTVPGPRVFEPNISTLTIGNG